MRRERTTNETVTPIPQERSKEPVMKKLAAVTALFALSACAQSKSDASTVRTDETAPAASVTLTETQEMIAKAFDTLVSKEDSEATLDLSYLKATDATFGKTLMTDMMELVGEAELDGHLELKALYPEDQDADDRLAELANMIAVASGEGAFYCDRFVAKPQTDAECGYRVVDLLSGLSHDPDARVYFGSFSANDYGSYRAAVVYIARPSSDHEAPVTIQRVLFDIVHEI